MATQKNPFDEQHDRNLVKYYQQIDEIFKEAAREAAAIGVSLNSVDPDKIFRFADYPAIKKRVDKLLQELTDDLSTVVVNGVRSEWTLANNKNDELCRQVFGDNIGKLSQDAYRRYFKNNAEAQEAFLQRKTAGLRLSDRVWNYTNQFKEEIELGLDIGIRSGTSADEMSRMVRSYLKHPDKLFRRVRDEHGQLQLSKAAAAYHPGRGVYRSSYKNALRLTGTETNIAYRTADYLRWQDMDFVVGILIEPSKTNHPVPDICDDLKGKYPKTFKFTGWHPQCRCHAVTILKTLEEMAEDNRRILSGEEPTEGSANTVQDLPKNFSDWVKSNKDRIEKAQSTPYFLSDNIRLITDGKHGYTGTKLGRKADAAARQALAGHEEMHKYSQEQQSNFVDITKQTKFERGKVMTFDEADSGQANIYKDVSNCAACVVAHEMRLRGFDITAVAAANAGETGQLLSADTRLAWVTAKGKTPEFTALIGGESTNEIIAKIEKATQTIGSRYHLGWDYIDITGERGHIITAERTDDGLVLYDPQQNCFYSLANIINEMKIGSKLQLLRVDRLLASPTVLRSILVALP